MGKKNTRTCNYSRTYFFTEKSKAGIRTTNWGTTSDAYIWSVANCRTGIPMVFHDIHFGRVFQECRSSRDRRFIIFTAQTNLWLTRIRQKDLETRTQELNAEEAKIADQRERYEAERAIGILDELGSEVVGCLVRGTVISLNLGFPVCKWSSCSNAAILFPWDIMRPHWNGSSETIYSWTE